MVPKPSYKPASLKKHLEDTEKGLSGESQFNRRVDGGSFLSLNESLKKKFMDDEADDDDDSSSDESDSDTSEPEFLKKIGAPSTKEIEIADSDDGRGTSAQTKATSAKIIKTEAKSSDESSDESGSEKCELAVKATDSESGSEAEPDDENDDDDDNDDDDKNEDVEDDEDDEDEDEDEGEDEDEDDKADGDKDDNNVASKVSANPELKTIKAKEKPRSGKEKAAAENPLVNGKAVKSSSSIKAAKEAPEHVVSDREMVDESIHIDDRQNENHVAPQNMIAPDFVLRKSNEGALGEDVARICNQAQSDGKQFWYFTLPSNVPISVVQNLEIPMDTSQRGEHVFSHAGYDYGISFERMAPKSSIQILIPTVDGSQYEAGKSKQEFDGETVHLANRCIAQKSVEQVMQVRRTTKLGGGDSASVAAGPELKRSSVPQPRGLEASSQPISVTSPKGNNGMDGEDCLMTDAVPTPVTAPVQREQVKRKDATPTTAAAPAQRKQVKRTDAAPTTAAAPAQRKEIKRKAAAPPPTPDAAPAQREQVKPADAAPTPAPVPAQIEQTKSNKKKDKKKTAVAEADNKAPSSRKGKRKHTTSEDDATAAGEQLIVESQEAESQSQSKKPKIGRDESPDLGSEPPSAAGKKKATAVPVSLPAPSSSMATEAMATEASTPAWLAKKLTMKTKKSTEKTPLPSSSQSLPPPMGTPSHPPRETPSHPPRETPSHQPRETPVPLPPNVLNSSARRESSVPLPRMTTGTASGSKTDKAKKRKGKEGETPKATSTTDDKMGTKKPTATG
ncbi:hypothetical protein CP533_6807 [Ophiocordyceps camponoti-saundersi (nom. inval.)]|nr:hypothetical protein CP533_6807 [Ophiocordyceps camponoti-saundersi (nom. inval.)]